MIKKLHYVWLGGKPLPQNVKSCIATWQKHMPDWEIIQWNENNFEVNQYRWVKEAIKMKRYAFAADFIRLYVLYTIGGGYLDTDVEIKRNVEPLIDTRMVCGIQNHRVGQNDLDFVSLDGIDSRTGQRATYFCVQAGFLYSEPHHQFIKHCMQELYDNGNKPFVTENRKTNQFVIDLRLMIELSKFGAVYRDKEQFFTNIDLHLYDSSVFATRKSRTKDSYLIHWFDQSWKANDSIRQVISKYIKKHFYWLYRRL